MNAVATEDLPLILIVHHFEGLCDPRRRPGKQSHPFISILFIALAAVLSGAETWEELEEFGKARVDWLARFVSLPNGVPCADTFRRVFSALDPKRFETCFRRWISALHEPLRDQVVAFDGKTVRGTVNPAKSWSGLHLLHVWAAEQKLLLGQCAVAGAPGEPGAVPSLLEDMALEGAVITADANGCTQPIAKAILEKRADYVLQVKGNRRHLHRHIVAQFETDLDAAIEAGQMRVAHQHDRGHGRIEQRTVWVAESKLPETITANWPGIATIAMVERHRTVKDKTVVSRHYFISSLVPDPGRIGHAIRAHWSVENDLHWSLDVLMKEDDCQIRDARAAQNFALLRRIALTILKRPEAGKRSLPLKRKRAGWDDAYLLKLLSLGVPPV